MCGIYGFTYPLKNPDKWLGMMGDVQAHRGPDGEGSFIRPEIAMGMRRLSIIDIDHGQQPFFNAAKTVAVICNGEIYNFVELREELKMKGHEFLTHNDIEVLPHLYDEYGIDFVRHLNGMFAIALYDIEAKTLHLVRDRLGIKPLYYAFFKGELFFASELKSITELNIIKPGLNYKALSTYLEMLYIPSPYTPFENIFKLDSGTILSWKDKKPLFSKYWEMNPDSSYIIDTEDEAKWQIEKILLDSARMEIRSDVPVGAFLSGGVDSSAVTAFAARQTDKPFGTFHVNWGRTAEKMNESKYAKAVSEQYHTKHLEMSISDESMIKSLPKLVWHLDEPNADGAFVPTYALASLAAGKVKVILSGAGGDELFGGYGHHKRHSLLKSLLGWIIYDKAPAYSYYDIWRSVDFKWFSSFFPWYEEAPYREEIDLRFNKLPRFDKLNDIMLSDIRMYLQDDILQITDRMTMAASLECRVPLLDHRLVELSQRIPSKLKTRGRERKQIFKKTLEAYLPKNVLYRKKEGFGAPVKKWVDEHRDKYFRNVFKECFLFEAGLARSEELERFLKKDSFNYKESWMYWKIMILEIWCQLYLGNRDYGSVFKTE